MCLDPRSGQISFNMPAICTVFRLTRPRTGCSRLWKHCSDCCGVSALHLVTTAGFSLVSLPLCCYAWSLISVQRGWHVSRPLTQSTKPHTGHRKLPFKAPTVQYVPPLYNYGDVLVGAYGTSVVSHKHVFKVVPINVTFPSALVLSLL